MHQSLKANTHKKLTAVKFYAITVEILGIKVEHFIDQHYSATS